MTEVRERWRHYPHHITLPLYYTIPDAEGPYPVWAVTAVHGDTTGTRIRWNRYDTPEELHNAATTPRNDHI